MNPAPTPTPLQPQVKTYNNYLEHIPWLQISQDNNSSYDCIVVIVGLHHHDPQQRCRRHNHYRYNTISGTMLSAWQRYLQPLSWKTRLIKQQPMFYQLCPNRRRHNATPPSSGKQCCQAMGAALTRAMTPRPQHPSLPLPPSAAP